MSDTDFRVLEADETIREGDEFRRNSEEPWWPTILVGQPVGKYALGEITFRRPLVVSTVHSEPVYQATEGIT